MKRDAIGSVLPLIVHLALYAAWLSRPRWHAALMSLTQAIEPDQGPMRRRAWREMATAAAFLLEAEWRKHAAGVVPAQPKERPEGQRPIGMPLAPRQNFFLPSLRLDERIAAAFRTILGPERHQAEQKDER